MLEVKVTEPPTSASVNGISAQNGNPSQTSMLPEPVMNPVVVLVRPVLIGGSPMQFTTTKMKSRMIVPIGNPFTSYVVTSTTTT